MTTHLKLMARYEYRSFCLYFPFYLHGKRVSYIRKRSYRHTGGLEVWVRTFVHIFGARLGRVNIVRMIKSRRMRWAGHVACMGEERRVYRVLVGKPEGKSHWGDLGVDG